MPRLLVTVLLATSVACLNVCAQTSAPAPNSSASQAPAPGADSLTLPEGTDVHLSFAQDLSSKTAFEGDPVVLLLDSDLKVGRVVVAKAGSTAYAVVTKAEKSAKRGQAGQLNIRLDYLKAGNNKIRLSGAKSKQDQSGNTGVVPLTQRFGPLGFIKHGNIDIKQGTPLTAYVADDIALPPA